MEVRRLLKKWKPDTLYVELATEYHCIVIIPILTMALYMCSTRVGVCMHVKLVFLEDVLLEELGIIGDTFASRRRPCLFI